jgi:predicted metal-binding membrane protein
MTKEGQCPRCLLQRDRIVVRAALTGVVVLAWIWLLHGAGLDMPAMDMPGGRPMMMMPAEWTAPA